MISVRPGRQCGRHGDLAGRAVNPDWCLGILALSSGVRRVCRARVTFKPPPAAGQTEVVRMQMSDYRGGETLQFLRRSPVPLLRDSGPEEGY